MFKPGVLGPGVVKVDYDCADPEARAKRTVEECPRGGDRFEQRGLLWRGSGSMGVLVSRLQAALGGPGGVVRRVVVDQTDLDGFYRFEIILLENEPLVCFPRLSVRELLEVQLGMTIQDTRALVDVFVVDAVSTPTPN